MVTIPARFNGPAHSGNGGYVAGMLAHELGPEGPVTSTLRLPPPLDVPLSWEHDGRDVRLLTAGGAVIGEATPGTFVREAPRPVPVERAAAGLAAYKGFHTHPFDRCFTCGTARGEGDGLRLFTGPVGDDIVAGTWSPGPTFGDLEGHLDVPVTWAALDCPGGWAADFTRQTMVLGRMTGQVLRTPLAGEAYVAIGELAATEGRKFLTSTALYAAGDELVGRAEQTWIQVDPADFA